GHSGTCNATTQSECEVQILDLQNPAVPSVVSGIDITGTTGTGVTATAVTGYGKYLFVAVDDSDNVACSSTLFTGCEIRIYDISNPIHPAFINGIDNGTNGLFAEFISGSTLYIGGRDGALQAWDVSNPSFPRKISSATVTNGTIYDIYGLGKYIFISGDNLVTNTSDVQIYDVSNPASMTKLASFDTVSGGSQVAVSIMVSGRYIYVGKSGTDGTAGCTSATNKCNIMIFDISNIASPSYVGGIYTDAKRVSKVFVSGKYLYAASSTDGGTCDPTIPLGDGCELKVYDISIPASPALVMGYDAGTSNVDAVDLMPYGKYLYALSADTAVGNSTFTVYDMPGIDTPTANFGETTTGGLNVTENASINGYLTANSLNVGTGGISSYGTLSVGCGTCSATTYLSNNTLFSVNGAASFSPLAVASISGKTN